MNTPRRPPTHSEAVTVAVAAPLFYLAGQRWGSSKPEKVEGGAASADSSDRNSKEVVDGDGRSVKHDSDEKLDEEERPPEMLEK